MDRISYLHESILSHIITFLPTTDEAIRTKILSKQWRYLPVPTNKLVFSQTDPENTDLFLSRISTFINSALPLDTCPNLDSYEISLNYSNRYRKCLELAVQDAIKRHVKEMIFELEPSWKCDFVTIPPSLCLYTSLETLTLRYHCLSSRFSFVQWTSLKALILEFADLYDDGIQIILYFCPKLEYLELNQCVPFNEIIDPSASTSLRKLVVTHHKNLLCQPRKNMIVSLPKVEALVLKLCRGLELMGNYPFLVDVYLDLEQGDDINSDWLSREETRDIFIEFLSKISSHVKRLTLGSWCIEVISSFVRRGLPWTTLLPKCKSLVLEAPLDGRHIPGILILLASSPYLETVVVDSTIKTRNNVQSLPCDEIGEYNAEVYWNQQNNLPERFLECLKIVTIARPSIHVYDFAKILLQNAKYLEKMELTKCNSENDWSIIIQNLLQLPRASPAAQILKF